MFDLLVLTLANVLGIFASIAVIAIVHDRWLKRHVDPRLR
jgi:hypothetical protein